MLELILRNESVVDLLRSNADLATDLLLGRRYGYMAKDVCEYHFICDHCHYSHTGPQSCPKVNSVDAIGGRLCPKCRRGASGKTSHYVRKVDPYPTSSCTLCDGFDTHALEPEL